MLYVFCVVTLCCAFICMIPHSVLTFCPFLWINRCNRLCCCCCTSICYTLYVFVFVPLCFLYVIGMAIPCFPPKFRHSLTSLFLKFLKYTIYVCQHFEVLQTEATMMNYRPSLHRNTHDGDFSPSVLRSFRRVQMLLRSQCLFMRNVRGVACYARAFRMVRVHHRDN